MDVLKMMDLTSALIVVGGTLVATVLRCGLADCGITVRALGQLFQPAFNEPAARAGLAGQIQAIQRDGLVRAHPDHVDDNEFDEATDALVEKRSISALLDKHEQHRAKRLALAARATRTMMSAAELSPVFGLAGTLISLNQISAAGKLATGFSEAIAMAVLTTLYGLLSAHLVYAPLARKLERRAVQEEDRRQTLIDWLSAELSPVCHHAALEKPAPPTTRGLAHGR